MTADKILDQFGEKFKPENRDAVASKIMPVLFIGHGSPMNAIVENDFTRSLVRLSKRIEKPKAIVCISAHWMTEGTWVTRMQNPKTIHDFYGFPKALFDVRYPAPGSPQTADLLKANVLHPQVQTDEEQWGLDHGTWSILRHMYPEADIPVIQLSVYMSQLGDYHFQVGQQLKALRKKGVLIVGSGNVVHNLRNISWETNSPPLDWALEFDEWIKAKLLAREHQALVSDFMETQAGRLSVPTPDHYYPLLYALGAVDAAGDSKDEVVFEYEGIQNGSISMRTISFGLKA